MTTLPMIIAVIASHCIALGRTPMTTFTASTGTGCAATIGATTDTGPRASPS